LNVSGTPRKVWQDELTKTPLVYAVDGKNFWINGAGGDMVRISAEGKKTQKLSLPDAYQPDLALPVNDRVAVFAHNKDGAAGWVFLQDGRSAEWLQLPSVSTDVFMSEWRGRQVWQKHKQQECAFWQRWVWNLMVSSRYY
jgi:sugar lactone lactonase YvrE